MKKSVESVTLIDKESDAFKIGLSTRLKGLRLQLGKSQLEMDDLLGIGKKSWQRCESGDHAAGSQVVAKLVQLGYDANYLLTGVGDLTGSSRVARARAHTHDAIAAFERAYAAVGWDAPRIVQEAVKTAAYFGLEERGAVMLLEMLRDQEELYRAEFTRSDAQ
jgi:transcriptional regulator with XRE-family HTH domain